MLRDSKKAKLQEEGGQALVEFILLIPIVLAFMWYLVHVSTAINKSIVGQKHARSQLFLKMFNHRSGPLASDLSNTERSSFHIGVSKDVFVNGQSADAPFEMLGVGAQPPRNSRANDDPGEAPANSLRQRVRVRTVFGICTHRKKLPTGTGVTDYCGSTPEGGN